MVDSSFNLVGYFGVLINDIVLFLRVVFQIVQLLQVTVVSVSLVSAVRTVSQHFGAFILLNVSNGSAMNNLMDPVCAKERFNRIHKSTVSKCNTYVVILVVSNAPAPNRCSKNRKHISAK
jgi:hypothetical protein